MKPQDDCRNGDGDDSGGEETSEAEPWLADDAWPARALAALNALRKSRQHYDTLLVAGGVEVPAHRAVLAAASPYLLDALHAPAAAPLVHRVDDVDPDALRDLVEFAYTGRAAVCLPRAARRLYRAAWHLRLEPARARLAERLLRCVTPHDCLALRALPDLAPDQLAQLDAYIAQNFDAVCESGALTALPLIRIEMLRESSAEDGAETPHAVAEAALTWLRDASAADLDLEELCARTHLLYVDAGGALRDCGELPETSGDAPELQEYRREAQARARTRRADPEHVARVPALLGTRTPRPECAVLAVRRAEGAARSTRALLVVRGRLATARVAWRDAVAGGSSVARGGALNGAREPEGGELCAPLRDGRCAHGAAVLRGRLVVCGGYDRARVLRSAEAYDAHANEWVPLRDMRSARARFPAARLGDALFALGGSDGHAELATVDALEEGAWRAAPPLPLAVSHAAAATDEQRGVLYVIGGWAGGLSLRRVLRYSPADGAWADAPPLDTGRSQCAGAWWDGALWVLGGCDAWHCLASTETLRLAAGGDAGGAWRAGPALPTARRSVGAAAWRGALVACGGSDGAASLRRTEWLWAGAAAWRAGPPLRRPRAGLALAALHDVLYAVGGFDGKEFLRCVECLHAPDDQWTQLRATTAPRASPARDPDPQRAQNGACDT